MDAFKPNKTLTLNLKGELVSLSEPMVMGILNVTPDSFFAGSRYQTEKEIIRRGADILDQGAGIIDLGAYSSRPDAKDISMQEELDRLAFALGILNREFPDAVLSVDTFRSEVARQCVDRYGVALINDISGGQIDPDMFQTVAELGVPYILMHMLGTPQTMMQHTGYGDIRQDVFLYLAEKIDRLRLLGVRDIIVDPGFGFSKTLDENYDLMSKLSDFRIFELPLLVGISRKSMIYKLSGTTPDESLNGTTALNMYALMNGAHILRVHDVKEAVETVRIYNKLANRA
ncbi:MAG: dihydropteroate synthase [Bacteroidales bacterium]